MNSTDTVKDCTNAHEDFINHRMGELKDILRKLAEGFIKFLFAAHSGGIIAVAAIIKIQESSVGTLSKIALTSFVVGLLLTAILLLKMLLRMYKVDKAWHKNSNRWYKEEISWGELNDYDEALTKNDKLEFSLAITSFTIFSSGAVCGVFSMWLGNG